MNTHQTTTSAFISVAGRVLIVALFLISGLSKLGSPSGTIGYINSAGLPFPELAYAAAIFVEIVLALAVLVGYKARTAAAVMAVFSVIAAFGFHFNLADQNQFIHFFKNLAIAGGLLQITAFGVGSFSVDAHRLARTAA